MRGKLDNKHECILGTTKNETKAFIFLGDTSHRTRKKIPGKSCNGTEINNLSHKEFKALVVRLLTELGRAEYGKNFNKQLENIERAIRAEEHRN